MNIAQINFGQIGDGRQVDKWHCKLCSRRVVSCFAFIPSSYIIFHLPYRKTSVDSVPYVMVVLLSDATDMQGGDYYSYPTTADLDHFEEQGLRLFDPEDLQTLVRQRLAI